MIASVSGRVLEVNSDHAVVEVGGVGLLVYTPGPVRDHLRAGESAFLFTYLVVREDSLTLYGFDSREGREFFTLLLGVNGVGPRLALSVLSTLSPDAIRRAVFHEQDEVFSRVPGVGKKTAQKILLHLQDRVPMAAGLEPVAAMTDVDAEVLNALTSLGYSVVEAQAALQAVPRDAPPDVEERLVLALRYFAS
ncbi:MAG: Holliday junction branch migration protein RuvA [Chloroflexi bacterium]|nr:Holliday junction branch migration protein RuvA [Chloroflexota bacterium]